MADVRLFSAKPYDRPGFEAANSEHGHALTYLDVRLGPDTDDPAAGADATVLVLLERGAGAKDAAKHLTARGYRLRRVGPQGRLNAFICPRGFEGAESRCEIRTDPRGLGYAEGK